MPTRKALERKASRILDSWDKRDIIKSLPMYMNVKDLKNFINENE